MKIAVVQILLLVIGAMDQIHMNMLPAYVFYVMLLVTITAIYLFFRTVAFVFI